MRRGERRKGWRKFWKNDDKKTDEMDRKECRKMMKTNKGRRWKMKKNVGWGVCMKAIYCWAWPSTTDIPLSSFGCGLVSCPEKSCEASEWPEEAKKTQRCPISTTRSVQKAAAGGGGSGSFRVCLPNALTPVYTPEPHCELSWTANPCQ